MRRFLSEEATRVLDQIIDFFPHRSWTDFRVYPRSVRRSQQHLVLPGDCEKDTTIIRARNHDRRFPAEELSIEDDVNSLAWSNHVTRLRIVHFPD